MSFPEFITASKVHASGNDFVLLEQDISDRPDFTNWVQKVCNRKFGVGSDGVIWVNLSSKPPSFRMWNPDGSQSEMCGNGLRCAMQWILNNGLSLDQISTDAGVLQIHNNGSLGEIDLGPAIFNSEFIPVCCQSVDFINFPTEVQTKSQAYNLILSAVSFGNPHVMYYGDFDSETFVQVAQFLQKSELFPASVNVHQVQVLGETALRMQTFERGAGLTMACGSGACAAATLHHKLQTLKGNSPTNDWIVQMPGGPVKVRLKPNGCAGLSGPAKIVAKIQVFLNT